jgi:hypothetical protein
MMDAASVAPVFPAETKAAASRCFSSLIPTTMDDSFLWRAACAGCSSMAMISLAGTSVMPSGRGGLLANSASTHSRKLGARRRDLHTYRAQALKRGAIRSRPRTDEHRIAESVDVEIHHRTHRSIAMGLNELRGSQEAQLLHIEKHDPNLRSEPHLRQRFGEPHEDDR